MRFLFVFLVFWTLPVIADTPVSGFAAAQPLLEKNPETAVAATPPNPANLTADWWRYFEVEPSTLKERINAADRYLNETLQELPEDEKSGAKAHIDRITENLPTLLELRKKTGPEALMSRPLQKTYKLRQWLDIVHKRRTLQAEVQSENENLLRDEKRYNAARHSLDSLIAAYLALPDQSHNKAVQGLAIMALWSELAINSERLRLQKAALSLHNEQLKQLAKEGEAIPDRLFINADDLLQLKQEIEVAERELGAARESSSQLEASLVSWGLETDEGKARSLLLEQQIRHNTIKEAIADAVVTRLKLELELAQMLTAANNSELDENRKQLQANLDHIDEISVKLDLWREEAERDQGRVGKSLAAMSGASTQQNSELINLTQLRLSEAQKYLAIPATSG